MIAELPDGSELRFPDTMTDAQVSAVVRRIMKSERAAEELRVEVESMRVQLAALAAKPAPEMKPMPEMKMDHGPVLAKLDAVTTALAAGFKQMVAAQLADTVLVRDETGDAIRSKKVATK